jgi:uncharacterized membrane protein YphA (DoxX/SURF4 family)
MDKILKHAFWDTHALLVARVLMGALFIISGIQKFQNIDGTAGYIGSVGLPAAVLLAWLAAIFEVVLGAAIVLGEYFRAAALLLAVFVLILAIIFHGPSSWGQAMQQTMFLKDLAIAAGLLFMAAHGEGRTWRLRK